MFTVSCATTLCLVFFRVRDLLANQLSLASSNLQGKTEACCRLEPEKRGKRIELNLAIQPL